jgi:hypothetical protein
MAVAACYALAVPWQAAAQVVGQDIVLTLRSGDLFRGVLLRREQTGFRVRTSVGDVLVPYADVVDAQATSAMVNQTPVKPEPVVPPLPASVVTGWTVAAVGGALALSLLAAHDRARDCHFSGLTFEPATDCRRDDSLQTWALVSGLAAVAGVGVAVWGHLMLDRGAGVAVTARF